MFQTKSALGGFLLSRQEDLLTLVASERGQQERVVNTSALCVAGQGGILSKFFSAHSLTPALCGNVPNSPAIDCVQLAVQGKNTSFCAKIWHPHTSWRLDRRTITTFVRKMPGYPVSDKPGYPGAGFQCWVPALAGL